MMSTEFRFVCALLATWRLTHLLTAEDGPADVMVRLRAAMGDSIAGRAMDCFYCSSLWIAAPLALFVTSAPFAWCVVWLALSGGACLLDRATKREAVNPFPNRAVREGEFDELLWTAPPGTQSNDRSPATSEAHVAGTIGTDSTRLPR